MTIDDARERVRAALGIRGMCWEVAVPPGLPEGHICHPCRIGVASNGDKPPRLVAWGADWPAALAAFERWQDSERKRTALLDEHRSRSCR
ncbi:hypothetical protein FJY71_01245 [candidate division WOR-3 bacterium]|nr:hypothetical protein [candidate division WOR-3 bacterium]